MGKAHELVKPAVRVESPLEVNEPSDRNALEIALEVVKGIETVREIWQWARPYLTPTRQVYKVTWGGQHYGVDNEQWQNNMHIVVNDFVPFNQWAENNATLVFSQNIANMAYEAMAALWNTNMALSGVAIPLRQFIPNNTALQYVRVARVFWAYSTSENNGEGGWAWKEDENSRYVLEVPSGGLFGTGSTTPATEAQNYQNTGAPQLAKALSFVTNSANRRARFGRIFLPLSLLEADAYGRTRDYFNNKLAAAGEAFINALNGVYTLVGTGILTGIIPNSHAGTFRPVVLSSVSEPTEEEMGASRVVGGGRRLNTANPPKYEEITMVRVGDVIDTIRRRRRQIPEVYSYRTLGGFDGGIGGGFTLDVPGFEVDDELTFTGPGLSRTDRFITGSVNQRLVVEELLDEGHGLDDVNKGRLEDTPLGVLNDLETEKVVFGGVVTDDEELQNEIIDTLLALD